jgi:hypothetical protein
MPTSLAGARRKIAAADLLAINRSSRLDHGYGEAGDRAARTGFDAAYWARTG